MVEALKIVERRARPRVETKVTVKVGGRDEERETYTGNLSKSGVFLETMEPFAKVGEKIQMKIILPHASEPVKVSGKVARIVKPNHVGSSPGMGIQFLRVEARQARTFDRLIDRLLDARGIGCRKYPRLKMQIIVELKSKQQIKQTIAENVSKGGLFLRTSVDGLVLGDTLNVVLFHPSSKRKFTSEAEVVHIRKGESKISEDFVEGVGIRFLSGNALNQKNEMSMFLRSILSGKKS